MKQFNLLEVILVSTLSLFTGALCSYSYMLIQFNEQYRMRQEAKDVIKQVEQDCPEYFNDVLMETDAWNNFAN